MKKLASISNEATLWKDCFSKICRSLLEKLVYVCIERSRKTLH